MIEFHELALDELRHAQSWYRVKSPRAAERFFEEVNHVVERAVADPASYPVIGRFRYIRIRRFPFILVYQVRPTNDVFVVAVAHTSRRKGYWTRRK